MALLTKEYITDLQKKLPPYLKYVGSVIIPYAIINLKFNRELCDLSENISLIP